jgi:restriction system protein
MAKITAQRTEQMQRQMLQILKEHAEGLPGRDVLARLAKVLPPNEFENSEYPNSPGVRRFEWIARFSSIPLVKAGWLVKNGGTWSITGEGIAALDKYTDPLTLRDAAVAKYREWEATKEPEEELSDASEGEQVARVTLEQAEERAWEEIDRHLASMAPYDLQELVAGLLGGMGYHISFIAPPGPDQGTDIIAHMDPLGMHTPRLKVQVKRRADRVTVDGIRAFLATLGDGDAGMFVSTGGFTTEAAREARGQERRKIMLIDAHRLLELWVGHYDRIPNDQRRLLPLKPIHYLDLEK